jgi:hypothetical protein
MRTLFALLVASSFILVSFTAPVAGASSRDPRVLGVEELSVLRSQTSMLVDELGLEEARRRALTDEVRSLAQVQILRPTNSLVLWDVLGSDDGIDWRVLGSFTLLEGNEPAARTGDRVPMAFIVGDLHLTNGRVITNIVASVADLGVNELATDSLLFHVHDVARNKPQAVADAVRMTHQAKRIPSLDLGDAADLPSEEADAPKRIYEQLTAAEACRNSCQTAKAVKSQHCLDDYGLCIAEATAVFGVCTAGCALLGETCFPVCVAIYGVQTTFCITRGATCNSRASDEYNTCINNCPTEPIAPVVISCAPDCGSPIVIDLERRQGFRFTDAPQGVSFDIDADGFESSTAWTTAGSEQAFLVWDRSGNGVIDDGSELFGDVTSQPPSADPNGFRALAMFDEAAAGGDEDGVIGPSDGIFSILRLWIDENHDGLSQPEELSRLGDAGIESIDLDYVVSNRRDRHGNFLRYKALVRLTDRVVQAVDVFFVQGASDE